MCVLRVLIHSEDFQLLSITHHVFFFIPLLKTHTPQSEPASICPDNYHKITKQTNYVRVNYIYIKKRTKKTIYFY